MKPRFTDAKRFRLAYEGAAASAKPNYLARRFVRYRELDAAQTQETESKVKALQKRKAA